MKGLATGNVNMKYEGPFFSGIKVMAKVIVF